MKAPIRVAVTGAAGQIGYALLFRIASGEMFGNDQPVILQLLEIPVEKAQKALKGVAMELDDCAFPLLQDMVLTGDAERRLQGRELVPARRRQAARPRHGARRPAQGQRQDLHRARARSIDEVAADDARVAVVGNPCNTNCMIAASQAKRLPTDRFTAMVRLDQNRAAPSSPRRPASIVTDGQDIFIYGNHSPTMFADFTHAKIGGKPAPTVISDEAWLKDEFLPDRRQARRGDHRGPRRLVGGLGRQRLVDHVRDLRHARRDPLGRRRSRTAATASTPTSGPACRCRPPRPAATRSSPATRWTTSPSRRSPRPTTSWSSERDTVKDMLGRI